MKIIACRNKGSIDVEFLDDYHYIKRNVAYINFKKGQVKNPFDRTMFGIGMLGVGNYKARENDKLMSKEYKTWNNMLIRCYDQKEKLKHEAYYDICMVCEKWHNYQNFAEWYTNNYYQVGTERMHLDKDILYPGNKLYSPETCLIVLQRINMLFLNKSNKRGLPNGIIRVKRGYLAKYNQKELGIFNTIDEAFFYYAKAKEMKIQEVAQDYRNVIPAKLYAALMDYRVNIVHDQNYRAS